MSLESFVKTLKNYGYSSQYTAQVMNTLLRSYTEHTFFRRIAPTRETGILVAFRILSDRDSYLAFTPQGLTAAEQLITERVRNISQDVMTPEFFFVLAFMYPHLEELEIQFLCSFTPLGDAYKRVMTVLQRSGLAYSEGDTVKAPKTLHTFFEFPFKEEPFQQAIRRIRAYLRVSALNKRIMKVAFSDMKGCKEEVMAAIQDMRSRGIIKEFVRDKGYTFRVLDAAAYKQYVQVLLNEALTAFRFVPPSPEYRPPVHCGWDSVGLLDKYPVPQDMPMNILLFGDPGPLKQIWAQHYLYGELLNSKGAIYLSVNSPPDEVRRNFQRFNKDISPFEQEGILIFIDCYPRRQKSSQVYSAPIDTSSLTDFGMVLSDAHQHMDTPQGICVIDSLSNVMLYSDPEQVIKFAVNQASRFKEWGWTGLFIVEKGVNDQKIENSLKFLLDGVFEIEEDEFRILWIRGMVDSPVRYALDISPRGLILLPKR
jgi:KaiC/GvpD/RAD55 family RecA-like ATPase